MSSIGKKLWQNSYGRCGRGQSRAEDTSRCYQGGDGSPRCTVGNHVRELGAATMNSARSCPKAAEGDSREWLFQTSKTFTKESRYSQHFPAPVRHVSFLFNANDLMEADMRPSDMESSPSVPTLYRSALFMERVAVEGWSFTGKLRWRQGHYLIETLNRVSQDLFLGAP